MLAPFLCCRLTKWFEQRRIRRKNNKNGTFGGGGKRNVGKVSGNQKSNKKRVAMWTHDFVCLAKADQMKTPMAVERSKLISAGTMSLHLSCLAFFSSG